MVRRTASAFVALLAVLLLFPSTEAKASPSDHPFIAYRLSISEDPSLPRMRLEISGWNGQVSLRLPRAYGKGLMAEPFRQLRDFRASDEQGKELPLTILENGVSFSSPGRSVLEYSADLSGYQAGSEHLRSLAPVNLQTYFPLAGDFLYLPGYAIFLAPEDPNIPCRVELDLPTGWTWTGTATEGELISGDLWVDPLLAGELTLMEREDLVLAYPSRVTNHLGLEEVTRNALSMRAELETRLPGGGTPEKTYLFFLPLKERVAAYGPVVSEPFSRTLALPLPEETSPLSDDALGELARQMTAALIKRHLNLSGDALWFGEGLAWYLRDMLPHRVGLWGSSLAWDRLLGQYREYEQTAGQISPYRAGEAELPGERESTMLCHGGAVVCAAIDAELQGSVPTGMDVLRLAGIISDMTAKREGAKPFSTQEIQEALTKVTGKNWKPFFDKYILGKAVLPASSFSSLKVAPHDERLVQPVRTGAPGLGKWATLIFAVLLVFSLPFFLEPYALRPRKEGFLEKALRE